MNPQLHYTPQQQMGYGGYSVPCRIGNWAEDEYLGVLNTAEHIAKSSANTLTTQKLGDLISRAIAPATLAPPPSDGFVHFGDAIMLSAAQGGVLALNAYKKVESTQEGYVVTRTSDSGAVPCTRTCWTVTPIGEAPADGLLRVGMRFYLKTDSDDGPMYLQSLRYHFTNQNGSASVVAGQRKSGCSAVKAPSSDTAWEVVVLEPTDLAQFESEGKPVLANTFVALKHCTSQANLSSDETVVLTKFGSESEVTVFTDAPTHKGEWGKRNATRVGVTNHWAFTTGA